MKKFSVFGAMLLGLAGAAHAADVGMPTKDPAVAAPAGPGPCANFPDFLLTSCYIGGAGLTLYGAIDAGYGYQTHGSYWNPTFATGASYLLNKPNNKVIWGLAPNGMSQSFIGLKLNSPIVPGPTGVSLVAAAELGFDPYSLQFAGGPNALLGQQGVLGNLQAIAVDSSRDGLWTNGQVFGGLSSPTYGTVTFGRQNTLYLDANNAYDPMGGSYAFSPIGFSGANAGEGFTDNARWTTAEKYRLNIGWFRVSEMAQWGGYSQGNPTTGAYQVGAGGDIHFAPGWGTFSFDAVFGRSLDATHYALGDSNTNPALNFVTASLANITGLMLVGKYNNGPVTISGGYTHDLLSNPSIGQFAPGTQLTTISLFPLTQNAAPACNFGTGAGCIISTQSFVNGAELFQSWWAGIKYNVTPTLDVIGAYYHLWQDTFDGTNPATCAPAAVKGGLAIPTEAGTCAGALDAVSGVIDWRFLPKWDAYFGMMFSTAWGGQQSGFLAKSNLDPTAGVRFRF